MTTRQIVTPIVGAGAALAAVVLTGTMFLTPPRVQADDESDAKDLRVELGFKIAPVPLKIDGKDRDLVGLGSYIVNAQGDCNGCHGANSPMVEFIPAGNPYFLSPPFKGKTVVNPMGYLGGGRNFGTLGPGASPPTIVARNLTPDVTGRPEGGHTFPEFLQIIRNGKDFDHLHPNCSKTITTNCFMPPFNGDVLQIMPWPIYANMSDHDLLAIYTYLSTIPCYEGPADPKNPLHNDCPK
jgi:hypothetical protein